MTASTFLTDAWLEWIERVGGRRAERFEVWAGTEWVQGSWFRDRRRQVCQPPLVPYIPLQSSVDFGANHSAKSVSELVDNTAQIFARERIRGGVFLPPEWVDARPFQWSGMIVEMKYTFVIALPHAIDKVSSAVRKRANKARRLGYTFHTERDDDALIRCLESTEKRQTFSHGVPVREIPQLLDTLGPEMYRCHVVRDSAGMPVSAGIRLNAGGTRAHDWVQGTEARSLKDGVVQLMYAGVLEDLAKVGYAHFDFGGANIRAVAAAKAGWGGTLTPIPLLKDVRAETLLRTWLLAKRRK